MSILVTGGAGFIGSNFILHWFTKTNESLINLDKLTYAGNLANLTKIQHHPSYHFIHQDIQAQTVILDLLKTHQIRAIIHFAAESHVDKSIAQPAEFISTNIVGTYHLLEAAKQYWQTLDQNAQKHFRFLHISTDEVFGDLSLNAPAFTETSCYQPNSPYSASKASSDHLVRSYQMTYGLPTIISHCSNNYGPFQFAEKLIPKMIYRAIKGQPLTIYGDGQHIRDWLFVEDHCRAIQCLLDHGNPGEKYNIGGQAEISNIEIVCLICDILDKRYPHANSLSYRHLIEFVEDRPGHDQRYAINIKKIQSELGWRPEETLLSGLNKTINWYLNYWK